jgi:hypothetical protein
MARKGDHTPDRPHRRAEIQEIPSRLELVTLEQLEVLAAEVPSTKSASTATSRRSDIAGAILPKVEVLRTFTKETTTYH